MKKELATIASVIILACNTIPPLTDAPQIHTETPEPIVEPLERKVIGIKVIQLDKIIAIGLAYDTDNNGKPDEIDTYLGHYHTDTDWMHLHEYLETIYKGDDL